MNEMLLNLSRGDGQQENTGLRVFRGVLLYSHGQEVQILFQSMRGTLSVL